MCEPPEGTDCSQNWPQPVRPKAKGKRADDKAGGPGGWVCPGHTAGERISGAKTLHVGGSVTLERGGFSGGSRRELMLRVLTFCVWRSGAFLLL